MEDDVVASGVEDPERKRIIIGHEFIDVFEREAAKIPGVKYLVQGTLYPDVIESKTPASKAGEKIKSHHNVGGLPEKMGLALIEPLRALFKDEVRELGRALGLPDAIVERQPFPGPGLAVRIIGDVTTERLDIVRGADAIVREEIDSAFEHHKQVVVEIGSSWDWSRFADQFTEDSRRLQPRQSCTGHR